MDTKIFYTYRDDELLYEHSIKSNHRRIGVTAHTHNVQEILFFQKGDVDFMIDGTQYRLQKNDLLIIPPLSVHELNFATNQSYERYDLIFSEELLGFPFMEKIPAGLRVLNFDGNDSIISLFKKMDFYLEQLEGKLSRLMLKNLIQELCLNILLAAKDAKEVLGSQTNPLVNEAIAYINSHLLTLSGIEEICRELFITKSHLHHLFIKHLNVTPKKYIASKRLAIAQREISFGAKPTEIYTKCGFSDYSAFYKAYKQQFGYSPSEIVTPEKTIYIYNDQRPVS